MPPFGKTPSSRNCGLRKYTVSGVPSCRLALVEPLPRSHSAMCSSSNTIVPPRGVTWAKPLGNTDPTRQTLAGKAVLMCDCRTFGILAIGCSLLFGCVKLMHSSDLIEGRGDVRSSEAQADKLADRLDEMGQIGAEPVETGQSAQGALVHVERAVDLDLQAVAPLGGPALAAHDLDTLV